ncbi:serine hydrolase domain-containing protein [Vagococcus intermedius]|uniref:Beta-lactamase family protein n=1 Tax=Vagococcus intermedius TaxID=2991418 RepID=A0AAF0I9V2_9ENTE|nr:serine hydrolase domain-containing protein [Vagococcus intermedius]WEG73802.1 beta-lactamase family protein [Vagococcus intermedius]WEG75887.1 beta-lactamase family protein [Vagococcus intermedius]
MKHTKHKYVRLRTCVITFLIGVLLSASLATLYLTQQVSELEHSFKKSEIKLTKKNKKLTSRLDNLQEKSSQSFSRIDYNKAINSDKTLSASLNQQINETTFQGSALVIKDNQVILNKGYGDANKEKEIKNQPDTEFMLASIQKSYTATLIMMLIQDKKLTFNTLLSEFYPEVPYSETITIRNLLDMSSGLFLEGNDPKGKSEEDTIAYVLKNVTYKQIDKWNYSSVNYMLLAAIIRQITGESYQDYLTKKIIAPLNLTHTGFYKEFTNDPEHTLSYDEKGKPVTIAEHNYSAELGTGNLYASTKDLLTYLHALMDGKLIARTSLDALWTNAPQNYAYTYASGLYHRDGFKKGHGLFRNYESSLFISNNGKNAVVLLQNSYNVTGSKLAEKLFKKL